MALTKGCYVFTLLIQYSFIFIDIIFNTITDKIIVRKHPTILFVAFILQDAFLLMSVTCLSFSLFRTNVFKVGFVELLLYRFKGTIIFAILYLVCTVALQTLILLLRWENPLNHIWPSTLSAMYAIQRITAVLFYYFYKRSTLRISDHRLYDEQWVKHALSHGH